MKKTGVFVLLLCTAVLSGKAQEWQYGLQAGVNISGFTGGHAYKIYDKKQTVGYNIGGTVGYAFENGINLSTGLAVTMTGGSFSTMADRYSTENMTEFSDVNARTVSLEVPVKVGYRFSASKNVSLSPFLGVYAHYAFTSLNDKLQIAQSQQESRWHCLDGFSEGSYRIESFKRMDYGWLVGASVKIANHYTATVTYQHSLPEVSSQYGLKLQGISLAIGYIW